MEGVCEMGWSPLELHIPHVGLIGFHQPSESVRSREEVHPFNALALLQFHKIRVGSMALETIVIRPGNSLLAALRFHVKFLWCDGSSELVEYPADDITDGDIGFQR